MGWNRTGVQWGGLGYVNSEQAVRLVQSLLSAGADINARADNGFTVLHEAVAGRAYKEVVELLVKAGADVHATCKAFWFPDDYYSNEVTNWWTVAARLGIALTKGVVVGRGEQEIAALHLAEAMVAAGWREGTAVADILRGA